MTNYIRQFSFLLPFFFLGSLLILVIVLLARVGASGNRVSVVSYRTWLTAFLCWIWGTCLITLYPTSWGDFSLRFVSWVPFSVFAVDDSSAGHPALIEVLSNLFLFFVGGTLAKLGIQSAARVVGTLTLFAVFIEIAQFAIGAGRISSVDDVLWAFAGSAAGAGFCSLVLSTAKNRRTVNS